MGEAEAFNFESVLLPDLHKRYFAGVLERGKINLYVRVARSSKSSTYYWYAGKNGEVLEIDNERGLFGVDARLIQNFRKLIEDNPTITAELDRQKHYRIDMIRRLVQEYNSANG